MLYSLITIYKYNILCTHKHLFIIELIYILSKTSKTSVAYNAFCKSIFHHCNAKYEHSTLYMHNNY